MGSVKWNKVIEQSDEGRGRWWGMSLAITTTKCYRFLGEKRKEKSNLKFLSSYDGLAALTTTASPIFYIPMWEREREKGTQQCQLGWGVPKKRNEQQSTIITAWTSGLKETRMLARLEKKKKKDKIQLERQCLTEVGLAMLELVVQLWAECQIVGVPWRIKEKKKRKKGRSVRWRLLFQKLTSKLTSNHLKRNMTRQRGKRRKGREEMAWELFFFFLHTAGRSPGTAGAQNCKAAVAAAVAAGRSRRRGAPLGPAAAAVGLRRAQGQTSCRHASHPSRCGPPHYPVDRAKLFWHKCLSTCVFVWRVWDSERLYV